MKDWYAGRFVNPLDRMTPEALHTMRTDAIEAHRFVTRLRDEAEAAGHPLRVFVLTQERKRLASIANEIRERTR